MADIVSSSALCQELESFLKDGQGKTDAGDSADEYKETQNVRMICGNSESPLNGDQGKTNRRNAHDQYKELKNVSVKPLCNCHSFVVIN